MPRSLGVGLLGLGRHGRRYAEHLARGEIREARLVAVWRRDRAAGRRDAVHYGVALAPSPIALCERPDVDIVAVVLPPGLYPPIVAAAARAGKAILLEKPLAATTNGARRILRAVRRAHVPAMVAHTLRFDSRVRALLQEVRKLGPVRTLHCVQHLPNRGVRWESEAAHGPGGILHQTATHGLDLIRFITGREARRVSCLAWRVRNPRLTDVALIRVELDGGATATLSVGKVSAGLSHVIEAVCDGGIVRADLVTGRLTVSWGGSATRRSRQREWVVPATPTVPLALGAFGRAIRAGRAPPVPLEDAARTHALVEAALTSARRGAGAVVPVRLR
ncbi:MAG TPA: Gfo/Idh/MocA family oxidoreductase [Gemmatimonadales bacterium]|nr:Gfo/Idh/MocA family oxidoreductase [Gemmatimonadales bacterium]